MKKTLFKNITKVTVCGILPSQEKLIDLDEDDLATDYETRQAIKENWLTQSESKQSDLAQETKPAKEHKTKGDVKDGSN